jgi:hypothetical protein
MAITKWDAQWADRGAVLSTELNSLAANTNSAMGTEVANQTNLDMTGQIEVTVTFAVAPAAGGSIHLYMLTAADGTNYEDVGLARIVTIVPVASTISPQRLRSPVFLLEPAKTKFILGNATSQAFPASGSMVKLFTQNAETV